MLEDDLGLALPTDAETKKIAELALKQLALERELQSLEEAVGAKAAELEAVRTRLLPEAMTEAGVSEFKLSNGAKVTVKKIYTGSIPAEEKPKAYAWLVENGHGDLVSHEVSVKLKRGNSQELSKLTAAIKKLALPYSDVEKIHPQTLNAFIKEQVESGAEFPIELFGVYIIDKATIKGGSDVS